MRPRPTFVSLVLAALVAVPAFALVQPAQASGDVFDAMVPTRADDGHLTPVTVYVADATPAPTLLWGHGWAGNRGSAAGDGAFFTANGYNVVAMDFRGHGAARSTSMARVHDVDKEIQDVIGVIDWIAAQPWAALDAAGDPTLGALGGSYGGGYQLLTAAFDDRLDALAPEITWNHLPTSLAPNGGIKSAWVDLLYGGGTAQASLDPLIHEAFAWAMSTNDFPDGQLPGEPDVVTLFERNSPSSYPDAIDVPTLLVQGTPDTLFNLNQALDNARQIAATGAQVKLFTHLGGHILSSEGTIPGGPPDSGLQPPSGPSPCGSVKDAVLAWYDHHFKGAPDTLPAAQLGVDDGSCVTLETVDFASASPLGAPTTFVIDLDGPSLVTGTRSGARANGLALRDTSSWRLDAFETGVVVAGPPRLRADLAVLGGEAIVYFGLESGRSRPDLDVINSQLTPVRLPPGRHAIDVELGAVVGALSPGEALFLTAVVWTGQHAQNPSREPSAVFAHAVSVDVPMR